MARTFPDTFQILIPEPESEIPALLGPLARRVREAIRRQPDSTLEDQLKLEIGYALFPEEGDTTKALTERVQTSRIMTD